MVLIEYLRYHTNSIDIINDLFLEIKEHQHVCIVVPSGCGKTTVLLLLLGFLKATEGNIRINGLALNRLHLQQIRNSLCWLPQQVIFSDGLVRETILTPFRFQKNHSLKPSDELIKAELEKLHLDSSVLEKNINQLSGGEKQRITLLICALLKRPLMILDEPTTGLDNQSKALMIKYFSDLRYSTILSVSHDDTWIRSTTSIYNLKEREWS